MLTFGSKLRLLRKKHGKTLLDVSREIGISVSFLSDVERGRTRPSLDTLEKLAMLYEVHPSDLISDVEMTNQEQDYPPAFAEFLDEVEDSDPDMDVINLLLQIEKRSLRTAETKEDWRRLYYSMLSIMGK